MLFIDVTPFSLIFALIIAGLFHEERSVCQDDDDDYICIVCLFAIESEWHTKENYIRHLE